MKGMGYGIITLGGVVEFRTIKELPVKIDTKCDATKILTDNSEKIKSFNKTRKTIIAEFSCLLEANTVSAFPKLNFESEVIFVNNRGLKLTIHRASININYDLNFKKEQKQIMRFRCVGLTNGGNDIYSVE